MKFCSGGMLAATRVKMSDSEKRVKLEHDIPSTKRVTRKFLEVSQVLQSCKTTAKKCTKKVCCTCKVAFLLIRPIVVVVFFFFYRSRCLRRSALTILYFV